MNFLIKNYKKRKIDVLDIVEHGDVIKNDLDRIYELSPSSSSFFISCKRNETFDYFLEMKISSFNQNFYYFGKHKCLKEAFCEAILRIREQILYWKRNRFSRACLNNGGQL